MATNVRTAVADRLGKSGRLSLKEDVFGIYSNFHTDNPGQRKLLERIDLIKNKPLVRVAQVTVEWRVGGGTPVIPTPTPQLDLDNANTIYQRECDAWVYCTGVKTIDRGYLTYLDQDDCSTPHSVSIDEDELFDLGRDLGANIVCYYIWASNLSAGGCAAHPPGRRGFWVGAGQSLPASPLVAFTHELTHVVGDNGHVTTPNNLMTRAANKPVSSTLTADQVDRILNDPDMEYP